MNRLDLLDIESCMDEIRDSLGAIRALDPNSRFYGHSLNELCRDIQDQTEKIRLIAERYLR